MGKFYVYVDYKLDDNKPFYVGKGSIDRVQDLKRNNIHQSISERHGIKRRIVLETDSELEAFTKEIKLIAELKTRAHLNFGGANLTDGGDGTSGYICSEDTKEKIRSAKRIRENYRSQEEKAAILKKISETLKDIWNDDERRKHNAIRCKEAYENISAEKKELMAIKGLATKKKNEEDADEEKIEQLKKKKEEMREKCRNARRRTLADMTKEDKIKFSESVRQGMARRREKKRSSD